MLSYFLPTFFVRLLALYLIIIIITIISMRIVFKSAGLLAETVLMFFDNFIFEWFLAGRESLYYYHGRSCVAKIRKHIARARKIGPNEWRSRRHRFIMIVLTWSVVSCRLTVRCTREGRNHRWADVAGTWAAETTAKTRRRWTAPARPRKRRPEKRRKCDKSSR